MAGFDRPEPGKDQRFHKCTYDEFGTEPFFAWLAGIGGFQCVLDSLEVPLAKAVTCDSNNMRAGVYRKCWGIDVLWSDITQVQEKQIHLLSEPPHVGLVTQAAGLPNLGPGNLDWGLLQTLLKPKALVEARCEDTGISIS